MFNCQFIFRQSPIRMRSIFSRFGPSCLDLDPVIKSPDRNRIWILISLIWILNSLICILISMIWILISLVRTLISLIWILVNLVWILISLIRILISLIWILVSMIQIINNMLNCFILEYNVYRTVSTIVALHLYLLNLFFFRCCKTFNPNRHSFFAARNVLRRHVCLLFTGARRMLPGVSHDNFAIKTRSQDS